MDQLPQIIRFFLDNGDNLKKKYEINHQKRTFTSNYEFETVIEIIIRN